MQNQVPADLLNDPEIGKAVEDLEVSGFTDAELRAYDKFWDSVSVERTLIIAEILMTKITNRVGGKCYS